MRKLAGLAIMAALGATAAQAQTEHLSDTAYLQAARCVGLASSGKLGATDADAMKKWLKDQSRFRNTYILSKADEMRRDAEREADQARQYSKEKLAAELSGPCTALKG